MTVNITRLLFSDSGFRAELDKALAWDAIADAGVQETVTTILTDVRARGDAAVVEWTNKLDRLDVAAMSDLVIGRDELMACLEALPSDQRTALETAAQRIRVYHEKQMQGSWQYTEADGSVYGQ